MSPTYPTLTFSAGESKPVATGADSVSPPPQARSKQDPSMSADVTTFHVAPGPQAQPPAAPKLLGNFHKPRTAPTPVEDGSAFGGTPAGLAGDVQALGMTSVPAPSASQDCDPNTFLEGGYCRACDIIPACTACNEKGCHVCGEDHVRVWSRARGLWMCGGVERVGRRTHFPNLKCLLPEDPMVKDQWGLFASGILTRNGELWGEREGCGDVLRSY